MFHQSIYMGVSVSMSMSIPISMSMYLSIYLSYLCNYLSICLSIYNLILFIYQSIHLCDSKRLSRCTYTWYVSMDTDGFLRIRGHIVCPWWTVLQQCLPGFGDGSAGVLLGTENTNMLTLKSETRTTKRVNHTSKVGYIGQTMENLCHPGHRRSQGRHKDAEAKDWPSPSAHGRQPLNMFKPWLFMTATCCSFPARIHNITDA